MTNPVDLDFLESALGFSAEADDYDVSLDLLDQPDSENDQ